MNANIESKFGGADTNGGNEAPRVEAKVESGQPSLREVGRARMERIGSFFSRAKERAGAKISAVGEAITNGANRAAELGIAGLETVMAAPEAAARGVETVVGGIEVAYTSARDAMLKAKNNAVDKKNSLVEGGKAALVSAVEAVKDTRDSAKAFTNRAMYKAAERISRPFMEFQKNRLADTLRALAAKVERGTASAEDIAPLKSLLEQLNALQAI